MKSARDERRSARIILLNAAQQVLLIRFVVERDHQPFVFWATAGGGVEEGETDIDAAPNETVYPLLHLSCANSSARHLHRQLNHAPQTNQRRVY
jgi:hypothetical protein